MKEVRACSGVPEPSGVGSQPHPPLPRPGIREGARRHAHVPQLLAAEHHQRFRVGVPAPSRCMLNDWAGPHLPPAPARAGGMSRTSGALPASLSHDVVNALHDRLRASVAESISDALSRSPVRGGRTLAPRPAPRTPLQGICCWRGRGPRSGATLRRGACLRAVPDPLPPHAMWRDFYSAPRRRSPTPARCHNGAPASRARAGRRAANWSPRLIPRTALTHPPRARTRRPSQSAMEMCGRPAGRLRPTRRHQRRQRRHRATLRPRRAWPPPWRASTRVRARRRSHSRYCGRRRRRGGRARGCGRGRRRW